MVSFSPDDSQPISSLFEPRNGYRENNAQATLALLDKVLDKLDIRRLDKAISKLYEQGEVAKN